MSQTTVGKKNSGRPAPRWFRKFKKIFGNTENTVIVVLLAMGYTSDSVVILLIKVGTSWILENLETLLANGEEYISPADQQEDASKQFRSHKN